MKHVLSLSLLTLSLCCGAVNLTPRQAFERVGGPELPLLTTRLAPERTHGLNIYGRADAPGFAVTDGERLLAWVPDRTYDTTNLPPAFEWWLEAQALVAGESQAGPQHADRANVDPMCTTQWDQGDPYNQLCPLFYGTRTITGCVATAMAQIMKVHRWPETGTGSISYGWNSETLELDFSTLTFDWDNMLDTYTSGEYTPEQATAVATLMQACGYASKMGYSTWSSGTYVNVAMLGLYRYLGYDGSMRLIERTYFSPTEWDTKIYSEISAGRPVLYAASNGNGSHAFVCDGYADGLYHINWGWSGTSNGWFELENMDPSETGSGASASGSPYAFSQSALLGISPAEEQTFEPLLTSYSFYGNSSTNVVELKGSLTSCTAEEVTVQLGVQFVNASTGKITYLWTSDTHTLDPETTLSSFGTIDFSDLDVGTYKAYICYKCDKGVKVVRNVRTRALLKPYSEAVVGTTAGQKYITIRGQDKDGTLTATDIQVPEKIQLYQPTTITFNLTWDGDEEVYTGIHALLYNDQECTSYLSSLTEKMVLLQPGVTTPVTLSSTLTTTNEEGVAWLQIHNVAPMLDSEPLRVEIVPYAPQYNLAVTVADQDPAHVRSKGMALNVDLEMTDGWMQGRFYILIAQLLNLPDGTTKWSNYMTTDLYPYEATAPDTFSLCVPVYPDDSSRLPEGDYYAAIYLINSVDNKVYGGNEPLLYFTVTDSSGIENVSAGETEAPVELYDLQGRRVTNPAPGIYLRRQGSLTEKILIK
ncbi:MAG: C10 family peptidase [Bacteroidales bacterium]|nr:C10 family peptidase [Bacteroidales bacterium]